MKKFPAVTLYFTLKKLSFLINNLEKSEFNNHCIPLMCKALDCGVQKIQEVILDELPKILKTLDINEFKKSIYNRLVKIEMQSKNKKIRKKIIINNQNNNINNNLIQNPSLDNNNIIYLNKKINY